MRSVQILVAGGGASGMMAAITAARSKKKVMIVEHMDKLGKKILATGNGKCNYTNKKQSLDFYRCADSGFVRNVLEKFDEKDTIDFFGELGIIPYERDGYIYPLSGQAVSVRNVLERELKKLGVQINLEEDVTDIEPHTGRNGTVDGYIVKTSKNKYLASKLIVAAGGCASPAHGSDGSMYGILGKSGYRINKPLPALTSCVVDEKYTKKWAGVRCKGTVSLFDGSGQFLAEDTGELQFVADGISGIPVFQISRFVSTEIEEGKKPYLVIDIMPDYSLEYIKDELMRRRKWEDNVSYGDIFQGMLHDRMVSAVMMKLGIDISQKASDVSEGDIDMTVNLLKAWRLDISGTGDFTKAQVTCGGIDVSQIDSETMSAAGQDRLFFCGEIVDVDAICGGYNLQWAWSSGYVAGNAAACDYDE